MTSTTTGAKAAPKRADARKNIAAILDAATECLARDPDASVSDIATAAGVGRVTLYGHFESRGALVAEVVERAMTAGDTVLEAVDLTGDPRAALGRLLEASWHVTHRYGGLVIAAQAALPESDFGRRTKSRCSASSGCSAGAAARAASAPTCRSTGR